MKYLIDIPDEVKWIEYIQQTHNAQNLIVESVCDLTPYTEPDRKAIEDEVWSLANEIAYCMSHEECVDAGMLCEEDGYDDASGVLEKLTYQDAKARYDAWKKSKDEIRVGDEVKYIKEYGKVVTVINSYGCCFNAIDSEGNVYHDMTTKNWVKTGRHFDVVDELLKKIREK